jgi:hypothetical protein
MGPSLDPRTAILRSDSTVPVQGQSNVGAVDLFFNHHIA